MKNPNGYIRIKTRRLNFLFDEKIGDQLQKSKDFMCSAFSFAMTSGDIPLIQNNTSFSCHIGKSDEILFLKNQMNTLGLNFQNDNSNSIDFASRVIEINHNRDIENYYIEGDKVISFNENLVFYKRKLVIPFSGKKLFGEEIISLNKTSKKNYFFYLPFFFHPEVELWKSDQSTNFLLKTKNNEIWRFETDKKNVVLEKYKFLDPLDLEIKNGKRIILFNDFDQKESVFNWKLYQ